MAWALKGRDMARTKRGNGREASPTVVPRRGLEPPRPCERQHLKLVRLPIPPPGHGASVCWQGAALKGAGAALSISLSNGWADHRRAEIRVGRRAGTAVAGRSPPAWRSGYPSPF